MIVFNHYTNIPALHRLCRIDQQEGSKFKAQPYDGGSSPQCICPACNSMYFVRAAAVCTKRKKKKPVIWKAATNSLSGDHSSPDSSGQ